MKSIIKQGLLKYIIVIIFGGVSNSTISQSSSASNALSGTSPNPTQYLGSSNNFDVVFKANATEYMRLLESNGNVGIGAISPQNLLHLNSISAANVRQQFTNSNTDDDSDDGFTVGIDASGNAILRQQEELPMIFYTNYSYYGVSERIRITGRTSSLGGSSIPATGVGISIGGVTGISSPVALLHLGGPQSSAGYRNWMDVGTYNDIFGDHVYFGLKDETQTTGRGMDAVISWGSGTCSNVNDAHYFRIIHTDNPSAPDNCTDV